ncbi:MAG: glucuronate isomerase [Clostridiales bacterium]|jgi:glucuronate isomerase|nr:glucuronate isomerase [Clostridiales bacterium]
MEIFMDENFLLSNETAVKLYHDHAADMPIYDYHCHLNPKEIWEDKSYNNITEVWLYGDHYKWRAMRANGVDEKYITGSGIDYDKFVAWANTVPHTIGNPLYHWTHLELRKYFDIYEVLDGNTADLIWNKANEKLKQEGFTARSFIKRSNVRLLCTTDDPLEDLTYHKKIEGLDDFGVRVLPTFRPDKGVEIQNDTFSSWVNKLEGTIGKGIHSFEDYLTALEDRAKYFHDMGCRLSDHGLEYVPYREASSEKLEEIFMKGRRGEEIAREEADAFRTAVLLFLGRLYAKLNWAMQLHIGAIRNNNTRMFKLLGPDTGFDSIHDHNIAYGLSRFLDALDGEGMLPRTILYTLNPKDNYVLASMAGNFQGDGIPGKIQFGSAWWFNDQRDGMVEQMKVLANIGLLSRFVGMLTDSRSFLSYTRHEYFRRILCNIIGEWAENGEVPRDMDLLGKMVENICFNNARDYFQIDL